MPIFHMPIILNVEADTLEEAQKAINDWMEEVDTAELPVGYEDMDCEPETEYNDEGQRVMFLPVDEEPNLDAEDDVERDDFNDDDDLA